MNVFMVLCPLIISPFLEICALLRCYAASNHNPLPTFRDSIGPIFSGQEVQEEEEEEGTGTLSRNVGKGLSFDTA
jgi:hypothetical protein